MGRYKIYNIYIDEDTKQKYYQDDKCKYFFLNIKCLNDLNDTVEILGEEKKEPKPLTKKDIEALGYACGEIRKCFTNGWTKSLENKPLEEEKKIPEKLENKIDTTFENYNYSERMRLTEMINKINEIIDYLDYLKSKGE